MMTHYRRVMMEDRESNFELSFRVLGNEVLGFKIAVDDFKSKWVVLSVIVLIGLSAAATIISPVIDAFK